jgi:hypothetical protein
MRRKAHSVAETRRRLPSIVKDGPAIQAAAAPPHVLHKDTTTATQTLSTGQFTFRIFCLSNAQFYPLATLTCSRFYAAAEFAREGLVRLGQTITRPARVTAGSMPRLPQRRDQARKRRSGSREMTLD